jgi:hypothetical protein
LLTFAASLLLLTLVTPPLFCLPLTLHSYPAYPWCLPSPASLRPCYLAALLATLDTLLLSCSSLLPQPFPASS